MHAWPIFWLQNTQKMCLSRASRTYARGGNPRQEKTMCFFLFFSALRGVVLRTDGECITGICLDGMQVFFLSSIFYEMVYEMREEQKEKVGGGTDFFMGK